ncbi:hypothetical protein AB0454_21600 [Streptomyces sp. NPDC093509]|uniref:hypothetical protein n=1 Tax=Streptomyces sp. NPDC093509 TaxID=3154982 RepID=UPI00344DB8D4
MGGLSEAVDRSAAEAEAEVAGDGAKAAAAFDAFVDLLVAVPGAGDQRPGSSVNVQLLMVWVFARRVVFCQVVMAGQGFAQIGAMSSDDSFDCLSQVVREVPGVRYLPCRWGTGLGAVSEGAGWVDALTRKVCKGWRIINVHAPRSASTPMHAPSRFRPTIAVSD